MLVVRPVVEEDLDSLYALSAQARAGLTTLPHDRDILAGRIKESVKNFEAMPGKPGGEVYLFVVEDLTQKKLVGTTAIFSKVGGFEPFYAYRIHTVTKKSKLLNVKKKIQYLKLIIDHNGPSEIGTLFLSPKYRGGGNGRLLSLSRFLFLAQYKACFEDEVIAELRGVIDENDHSPFWEALGRHFFEVEFKKADLMVMKDKSFIAELIPKHPIYIPLLSQEAQNTIGKAHQDTQPALHLLKQEGFAYKGEIDIFEAGPLVRAKLGNIRTVKESQEAVVTEIKNSSEGSDVSEPYLVANVNAFKEFRVVVASLEDLPQGIQLTPDAADALKVKVSDKVRFVRLKPHGS